MIASFTVPAKIVTGWGSAKGLGGEAKGLGTKALLVTGKASLRGAGITDYLVGILKGAGVGVALFEGVESEPSVETVDAVRTALAKQGCDLVVAAGGGSVIDAGKAAARLATSDKPTAAFYREPFPPEELPCIAMPTTAGTGAETTGNSVLTDTTRGVKESIRGPGLMADVAIVDAALSASCPPAITYISGLDAFVQAIESYLSRHATPLTDSLSLYAVELIWQNLLRTGRIGHDQVARENMAYASLLAGMAMANARLGAVHGLAHAIGHRYHMPHGTVCATLLPTVLRFNQQAAGTKYEILGNVLGGSPIEAAEGLLERLQFPLRLDIRPEDFDAIVKESMPSGSMQANPRTVSPQDAMDILRQVSEKEG